ncbi:MAG: phosphate acetyltransferase [Candidatus Scalindua sp. AMX11]|nr:MAG: phosphate acetyltransferase [Candidatus Scalindua sp.]NOG85649.1 phosphate acetyltransferase [Planctomycetota bacterium]RZV82457.1 MAG: phosphate acetyltransferase [Candidatus Scalindua sp. SCAELEC01]TDE65620.1 MAG: phosphate acetyltransferase [Candidatus Scalindua sp. AMX11]GJQ59184.1 MAG: phosphate acetyltransferase [Candidatus Scalindua sp.]
MAKNIFLASTGPKSGKSVVCLGLIDALRGIVSNVGYFKPIGQKYRKGEDFDKESIMIKEVFCIEDELSDINPVSLKELRNCVAKDDNETFFREVQDSYKKVEKGKDIVVIDGTDYLGTMSAFELDINADLANNLNAGVILVEDGYGKSLNEIYSDVLTGKESFEEQYCEFLGVVVNKVEVERYAEIDEGLRIQLQKRNVEYFGTVPYDSILPRPRLYDIVRSLDAEMLFGHEHLSNIAVETIIASMGFGNALKYLHDGTLIITGGDRDEILLGCIVSLISPTCPNISGIVLTGGLLPNRSIMDLIGSLSDLPLPIFSVKGNTIKTANRVDALSVHVSSDDKQKIDIAKDLVCRNVDYEKINDKLNLVKVKKRTPEMFKYELIERARLIKRRIVLPEGNEERILKAAEWVRARGIADLVLLGKRDEILKKATLLGVKLDSGISIEDPTMSEKFDDYVNTFYELRKHKNYTIDMALDRMQDAIYYGTMMIYSGDVDGLVSGAVNTTQHTIRPAFEIIKTKPGIVNASSVFLMCLKERVLVYGDCAIIPKPNAEQLADIAISSSDTAKDFNINPVVAMLSYSTGKSGRGPEVEKVREATEIARRKRPDLIIEGPIQYDAAVDPDVARIKLPDSSVAGKASVLIFPDLNTGNNTYKAVQRSAGAVAIGPVLQGLKKPVNDLSRGCRVEDIVYTVAITAIQAQST